MVAGMRSLRAEEVLRGATIEALLTASLLFVASSLLRLTPSTHRAETVLEGLASTITVTEAAMITVEKTSASTIKRLEGLALYAFRGRWGCAVIRST